MLNKEQMHGEFNELGSLEVAIAIDNVIAEYAKRKCQTCVSYDGSHKCNNENSIASGTDNRVYPYDGCIEDWEEK